MVLVETPGGIYLNSSLVGAWRIREVNGDFGKPSGWEVTADGVTVAAFNSQGKCVQFMRDVAYGESSIVQGFETDDDF